MEYLHVPIHKDGQIIAIVSSFGSQNHFTVPEMPLPLPLILLATGMSPRRKYILKSVSLTGRFLYI